MRIISERAVKMAVLSVWMVGGAGLVAGCSSATKAIAEIDEQLIAGPLAMITGVKRKKAKIEYTERPELLAPADSSLPIPTYVAPQPQLEEKRSLSEAELQAIVDENKRRDIVRRSDKALSEAERNERAFKLYKGLQQRQALRDAQGNLVRHSLSDPPVHLRQKPPGAPDTLSADEEKKQGLYYRLFKKKTKSSR